MRKILLVEPNYKNKYPPMGLMKISTYHKLLGDEVTFVKGIDHSIELKIWDRIYVTTLFTFDFNVAVKTINYYKQLVDDLSDLFVGGILASLMPTEIMAATGLERKNILVGLLEDTSTIGDDTKINIDQLPLDYDMLENISYKYPAGDNYFAYMTRGCPNHCPFCAVPILEPEFIVTNSIIDQIDAIDKMYGPKQNLLLLDNNILNAPNLSKLVDDLCKAGFYRGAKFKDPGTYSVIMMRYHRGDRAAFLDKRLQEYLEQFKKRIRKREVLERFIQLLLNAEEEECFAEYMLTCEAELKQIIEKYKVKTYKSRFIDFNQGIDARKINDENMEQLSRLEINPLRIAFDDIKLKKTYVSAVEAAHRHGINKLSNYILFNYEDQPEELYERLRINIELNESLKMQIFSFPMRYSPVQRTDRDYVGLHWNKKYLRAVSAILQVTKGVVAAGAGFFYKAFGHSKKEFFEILSMPREFIMFRAYFENNGKTQEWRKLFNALDEKEKDLLINIVSKTISEIQKMEWPDVLKDILPYYLIKYRSDKIDKDGQIDMDLSN